MDQRSLNDFMHQQIEEVRREQGLKPYQAFARWFANLYFAQPDRIVSTDGAGDGKIDLFLQDNSSDHGVDCVLNTKFTQKYRSLAPPAFYSEVLALWRAFANKDNRDEYLESVTRPNVRMHYKRLFRSYDDGNARLYFVTNHRRNDDQIKSLGKIGVELFHWEEILQFVVDFTEDAMPITPVLELEDIQHLLTANERDSAVPTSIVFARLTDFIAYMQQDKFDLLFARNIRLSLGNTPVNKGISKTFRKAPKEFAYSNNGITLLCEDFKHEPFKRLVEIINPRIVNGSQTLHSVRDVPNPPSTARVMVRIIKIERPNTSRGPEEAERRRKVIRKISMRSNFQNPVKKWNLVSNDEFQLGLARYFRKQKLFYERRQKEWQYRSADLKSLKIEKGPRITRLAQLIASYYWDNKLLGPAEAMASVSALFDDEAYEIISSVTPELAHQLYLLDRVIYRCLSELSHLRYVRGSSRFMHFTLFALIVRALTDAKTPWTTPKFTTQLEDATEGLPTSWISLVKLACAFINTQYVKEAKSHKKKTGKELSYPNYFKSRQFSGKLFSRSMPAHIRASARKIVRAPR